MIDPYFDDGQVQLYNADAMDVLPNLPDGGVDAIITDPPYNISGRNGRDNTTAATLKRRDGTARKLWKDFGDWDRDWAPEPFLAETVRILRGGGSLIAWTSEHLVGAYMASGLYHRNLIYWHKTNPTPAFRNLYVNAVEIAVWQVKGRGWTFNAGGYHPNIYDCAAVGGNERVHPNQKPLGLMHQLITVHTNENDLTVDPYAGSGTTLVAAKRLGRRAIGVEASEQVCEAAAKRLTQGVLDFGGVA